MLKSELYAQIVAHHPYVVASVSGILSVVCLVVAYLWAPFPSFSDPQLGFETRETELGSRRIAWEHLREATKSGVLVANPHEAYLAWKDEEKRRRAGAAPQPQPSLVPEVQDEEPFKEPFLDLPPTNPIINDTHEELGDQNKKKEETDIFGTISIHPRNGTFRKDKIDMYKWITLKKIATGDEIGDPLFSDLASSTMASIASSRFPCGQPLSAYSRLVFRSPDPSVSLWSRKAILSMCLYDALMLRSGKVFRDICQLDLSKVSCCPSWSIGTYIALLRNRQSCLMVTDGDMEAVLSLLHLCAPYYHSQQLLSDCESSGLCIHVPDACKQHDAIFHILYYMTDEGFFRERLNASSSGNMTSTFSPFLNYAVLFLPVARSSGMLKYYLELLPTLYVKEESTVIQVEAVDFGLKYRLFDYYIFRDTMLVLVAAGLVFLLVWFYSASLFVTITTALAISFSLGISLFIYRVILQISAFPFMNVLTSVIAVAVGADNVFIYVKVWSLGGRSLVEGPQALQERVRRTLEQAFAPICVTSLTTSAALLTSYASHITAIKCFSVFAGLTVMSNFVLMLTFIPACVVISERCALPSSCSLLTSSSSTPSSTLTPSHQVKKGKSIFAQLNLYFSSGLNYLVLKLRWIWVFLFASVGAVAGIIVLHKPGLHLPSSMDFRLFPSTNFLEKYEVLRSSFRFETNEAGEDFTWNLPLRFVWGVLPEDNGSPLDPYSRGTLKFDQSFNMSDPESQVWLLQFCRSLRHERFYEPTLGPLLPNCFIETFHRYLEHRGCNATENGTLSSDKCCEVQKFPYTPKVFQKCLLEGVRSLHETPSEYFVLGDLGPRFAKGTSEEEWKHLEMKTLVVEYSSNIPYSFSHEEMRDFFQRIERWSQKQFSTAPNGLKNGWFISELEFYDIQNELSSGSLNSIGLAAGISFLLLLLTTQNPFLSVLATVTVVCAILVTLASLVLLGWELGILEAVSVTLIIGMAVDFSLHYSVAFRFIVGSRKHRVSALITDTYGPVLMGALTTFMAGIAMIPAHVLPYIKMGLLLMTVSAVSWLYATFFFNSLLAIWGPTHSCCCCCQATEDPNPADLETKISSSNGVWPSESANFVPPPNPVFALSSAAFIGGRSENQEMVELQPQAPHHQRYDLSAGRTSQRSGSEIQLLPPQRPIQSHFSQGHRGVLPLRVPREDNHPPDARRGRRGNLHLRSHHLVAEHSGDEMASYV